MVPARARATSRSEPVTREHHSFELRDSTRVSVGMCADLARCRRVIVAPDALVVGSLKLPWERATRSTAGCHGTMRAALLVIMLGTVAHADRVTLDVAVADATKTWVDGRVAPWVVVVHGVKTAKVRVDCFSPAASYVRAHDVRDGVPAPAIVDAPPRTIPTSEQVDCHAYVRDRWVASWSGKLAWPKLTLPDHRITNLAARRCGDKWCVGVTLDRSHPGTHGADVEVACTLKHASIDPFFVETAPASRGQVTSRSDRVQLTLDGAPGATVITCSVDRGLYGHARFADADPTNNETATSVVPAPSPRPHVAFLSVVKLAAVHPGCGHCSTYIPGTIDVTTRIHNQGKHAIEGLGIRCETTAAGTRFQLRNATGALAAGETRDVIAWIEISADTAKLVGTHSLRCDAIVWTMPATPAASWTGKVAFPKP